MRTIYKRDSAGRLRVWSQELEGNRYRTHAGLADGALVVSGWTTCFGKQGRTDEQQAAFEVEANYKHKLTREYHETSSATAGGAHFFKPMLAHKYESWQGPCWAQPKLDGIRCIATAAGLFSREGKPIFGVPHIAEALASEFKKNPDLVLDGELYNHEFRDDFGAISSIVRKQNPTAAQLASAEALIQYHIYDIPSHNGSFSDRSLALLNLLAGITVNNGRLCWVDTRPVPTQEALDTLYGKWLEDGWEGQMIRLDAPYEQKRSKSLLKRKEFLSEEFECLAIEEGNGNWAGLAKRVICRLPDGRTFGAGIKGNADRAAELLHERHSVVTVQYFMMSPDGVPRFPIVVDFHGDNRID